jgi:hypothetical protein
MLALSAVLLDKGSQTMEAGNMTRLRLTIFLAFFLLLPQLAMAQQSQPFHLLSAASTNSTNIKPASGQLVTAVCINTTTTLYYLKFYDLAAAPTCNTSTVVLTIPCPFGASSSGGGFVMTPGQAAQFLNGIGMCLTGGIADNDNTNAATGVAVDVFFK